MRYFKDNTNQVYGYDEANPSQLLLIQKAIAAGWAEITGSWPPSETQLQAQTRLSAAISSSLNKGAQQWQYDDIVSAVSYINSTNPQYAAEAKALNQWRDIVWIWAATALPTITAGETEEQFLANMPAFPTKPQ